MAYTHGKTTVFKVATKDLSVYTTTSSIEYSADSHETTGYGKTAKTKAPGLLDSKFTASGTYDDTAANGPRAVLRPLIGTVTAVVRQPEGTGTGKPQDAFSGVLTKYVETNPVDGMITWSAEWDNTDVVNSAAQA